MIIMYNHKWLFLSFFTFWEQFIDIPVNTLSIRAVYCRKMSQNIPNIHILWAFIWLNERRLKSNGCMICSTIYFPTEIYIHYAADCIASGKETVAEPPGTLPRPQEPLRSHSEARNRNDSPACTNHTKAMERHRPTIVIHSLDELPDLCNKWDCTYSTDLFKFRWPRGYICNSSYRHHQIGSINFSHGYCYMFPLLCVWGSCGICHLLWSRKSWGFVSITVQSMMPYMQIIGYITRRSHSFICTLRYLITIIMQIYLKALNI